jgi:hypothetical protein
MPLHSCHGSNISCYSHFKNNRILEIHRLIGYMYRLVSLYVVILEAKYVESWPSTTFARAGWSRFDIPVDRSGGVCSLLQWPSRTLVYPISIYPYPYPYPYPLSRVYENMAFAIYWPPSTTKPTIPSFFLTPCQPHPHPLTPYLYHILNNLPCTIQLSFLPAF